MRQQRSRERPAHAPVRRRVVGIVGAAVLLAAISGCSWFSSDSDTPEPTTVSVFQVEPGQCFTAPGEIKAELSDLSSVPCSQPHRQEAYAVVPYQAPDGVDATLYPGDATLTSFAQGACAQKFAGYVGVSYLDSSLYFTYLLPSARSWEQGDDRSILCFVINTGTAELTASAKGSKI